MRKIICFAIICGLFLNNAIITYCATGSIGQFNSEQRLKDDEWDGNFTLTVNIIGEGFVEVFPDNESYPPSTVVQLNETPEYDWVFEEWSGDINGNNKQAPSITITMDQNKTINATFRHIPTILIVHMKPLPWNRLEIALEKCIGKITGWRGYEQEVRIRCHVENEYNKMEDASINIRTREWMLDSKFPKLFHIFTNSGGIYTPEDQGKRFINVNLPIEKGTYWNNETIIKVNLYELNNMQLATFAWCIDTRCTHISNSVWGYYDIEFL